MAHTVMYSLKTVIEETYDDGNFIKYMEYENCTIMPPVNMVSSLTKCVSFPAENKVMLFDGDSYVATVKLSDVKFNAM